MSSSFVHRPTKRSGQRTTEECRNESGAIISPPGTVPPGEFVQPDRRVADAQYPHEVLAISAPRGTHSNLIDFKGRNTTLDSIISAIESSEVAYEAQCSGQHYYDLFTRLNRLHDSLQDQSGNGQVKPKELRIVDVGVFMGGSSAIFAGYANETDLSLDLVDINWAYLQFTYERLRRMFPGVESRVRMFWGGLPDYVRNVLIPEDDRYSFVHHDGSHDFTQVVTDLACLSYVRDAVLAVAIQDTHLRSSKPEFHTFVDAAVYAVFGKDVHYEPIGTTYPPDSPLLQPNQYEGNYFLPDTAEGMYIKIADNDFKYPHPSIPIDSFFP
jgi:hypothetical protein